MGAHRPFWSIPAGKRKGQMDLGLSTKATQEVLAQGYEKAEVALGSGIRAFISKIFTFSGLSGLLT